MDFRIQILAFLLIFASTLGSVAQDGQIKSVEFQESERPEEAPDTASLTLMKKELKEFDKKGRMVKYILHSINPGGYIVKNSEILKTFEDKLLKIEERKKYDEMGDLLMDEKIYFNEYKEKVKVEYVDHLKNPNEQFTKEYEYDNKTGNVDKVTLYDSNGKKVGQESWKYNRDNEEVKYTKWKKMADGSKYKESKVTDYDKSTGSLLESVHKIDDGKDKYEEVIIFERNKIKEKIKYKNGEIISQFGGSRATFDPNKARVLVDFGNDDNGFGGGFGMWANEDEYDDDGKKIKTTQTVDGVVKKITHYNYDDRNNLTKTIEIEYKDGQPLNTQEEVQEFDKNNNMLRKAVYNNGVIISEKKYDYQYY